VKTPTSADENPQPFELIERIEPFEHIKPPKPFVRVEYFQPLQTSSTSKTSLFLPKLLFIFKYEKKFPLL